VAAHFGKTIMSARENILGRLRAVSTNPPNLPDVGNWYDCHRRDEDFAQRAVRLRVALEAVHTEVHDTTLSDWPDLLLGIASNKGLHNLLIGVNTPHGSELEARHPDNLKLVRYEHAIESWRDQLFDEIDAAFTLARSAIAETGSLILWPDAAEPRLMSLVPHIHFVLLDVTKIHADLHSAMSAENWQGTIPTNALLISGPSKTADIQQTLAYGAHGPRELVVLLCHPAGAKS
jgi:L-lactate dehydrogenase complex protein LldG